MTAHPTIKPILYLDYQATTPCDKRVVDAMLPYFYEKFGNPHSLSHAPGLEAKAAIEQARQQVASLIHADAKDIIFTSGATESNNLALKGAAYFYKGLKNHIITCVTEHKCVLDTCRHLEQEGFSVTYMPVQANGRIDLSLLESLITDKTLMVSIMAVNNEIGVIQALEDIGRICQKHQVLFHTDAAQAVGKIPLDVNTMNISLLSLSGHKIYGPKGIGALYVRRKPRVRLVSLINGGGQERGMRSGTLPTPLCVGLGQACALAQSEMASESQRIKELQYRLYKKLSENLPEIYLNGDREHRIPGNLNISFSCVEGEGLMMGMDDIAVSSGSACTSESLEASYVLRALGVSEELAHTSLRIGIGRFTTPEDIDYTANKIIQAVNHLRNLSPLWEMTQAGVDLKTIQWTNH